jgi:DNA-binding NtrC family response regulator
VNIAAVPDTLLEAEFFGVAPGAYTGADRKGRDGKFKLADGGTLFLDEIGDMPQSLQAKLLRALQEGEIEPLGSNKLVPFNVRVVAATSRDLGALVREGSFAKTCTTACMCCRCACRRCASGAATSRRWSKCWAKTWPCATARRRPS